MTPELVRFIVNVRATFGRLTDQQLYQLAVALGAELHDRHTDCEPEARALCAALLAHAQREHQAVTLSDVSDADLDAALPALVNLGAVQVVVPPASADVKATLRGMGYVFPFEDPPAE